MYDNSSDGFLCVWDVRANKLQARSDAQDEEMTSLAIMKNGAKLLTGSQEGVINVWNWDRVIVFF